MRWIVLAVSVWSATAMAEAPADKKLATKTPVLADHLSVMLPAGMKVAPRRPSIMSAEESGEDETRAMLDDGKARFVMMAYEMYSLAGADAKATVEGDFKTNYAGKGALVALALPKPLVGFAMTPTTVAKDREANVTYAAWIASSDGSIQFFAFYVNPDGAAQGASWSALAKKIVATAMPGKRMLTSKAGDRTLQDLAITVPDGWVMSAQQGPDFTVFHLRKLVVLGQAHPTCGVYVGHHPSFQHKQQDQTVKPTTLAGTLFGAKVDWSTWNANKRWSTEVMAKHPGGGNTVHVFCSAEAEKDLADLRKMAGTLRKK